MPPDSGSPVDPRIRPHPHPTRLAYLVRALDRVRNRPFHTTLGTYYEDVMLTVILAGKGRYYQDQTIQEVRPGMVGLIIGRSGVDPGVLTADPDDPYDHIHCRFAGHEAVALARRIEEERQGKAFTDEPQWQQITNVLERALAIGHVIDLGQPRNHLIPQDACLMEALILLDKPPQQQKTGLNAARLKAYLQEHVATPAALDPVAEHFGISKWHLCRLAREMLGMPPHQYWMRLKIQWAKTLLRQPGASIAQVARQVGFSDQFHFSKTFKKATGMSPRQWRQQSSTPDA